MTDRHHRKSLWRSMLSAFGVMVGVAVLTLSALWWGEAREEQQQWDRRRSAASSVIS